MRKYLPETLLKELGWKNINVNSTLPSYCENCGQQRCHKCTGKKDDGAGINIFRFECTTCIERLTAKKNIFG